MEKYDTAKVWFALGGMILLGALLSYFFFLPQSLRLDEAQSLWESSRSPSDIVTLVSEDVHVPLYHELLHFWRLYLGDSVTSARLLSLVFFLAAIPALYALGKAAYSARVGLYSAFLFAISPFMNWYGNEIRMYTLLTLVVILNQYCYLTLMRHAHDAKARDTRTLAWVGYFTTTLVGAFVHYFFFLNLLAQAVFYFMRRELFPPKALRNFIGIALALGAVSGPWFWYVYTGGQAAFQTPLLPTPTTVNFFSTFSQFLFGFQTDGVNTVLLSLWPMVVIFGFLMLRRSIRLSPTSEYLLFSVLLPVLVAFGVSFIVPVFTSRYLIFTVPALLLLISNLFETYRPRTAGIFRFGLAALMLAALGIEVASAATPVKEDYAGASQYLVAHATAQDVVLLAAPFTIYPVQYYYRGEAPLGTLPQWDQYAYGPIPPYTASKLPSEVVQETSGYQNVWLLLSYDQGYNAAIKHYFDDHYQREVSVAFSPGLNLYEYKLRYDTTAATHATTTTAYAQ